jgi:purine nucleosidase
MTANSLQRIVIDTDIGVDDAVALVLALRTRSITVAAITTVAGNTDVDQCVRNARYVTELCGADVPIYRGSEAPLDPAQRQRPPVHGGDGLGDRGLRPAASSSDSGLASDRLLELAMAYPGELTLVTLGPLTNLALALRRGPEIARLYRRLVVMGGATTPGTAEFNFWSDPVAASEVFAFGLSTMLVPIEPSQGAAALSQVDVATVTRSGTEIASFVQAMCESAMRRNPSEIAGLPDALAMAVAIDPSVVTRARDCQFEVETGGGLRRVGPYDQRPVVRVVDEIDADRYKSMILAACR